MQISVALNSIYYVFWREMKRYLQQRLRIFMSVFQPVVWLVLMGNMMSRLADNPFTAQMIGADSYLAFMTPGIMIMSSLFSGVFGGISLIWDRRLGFLVKLLSAPIPRFSIALGKISALVLQAMFQVLIIVVIAVLLGVSFAAGPVGFVIILVLCGLFAGIMSSISLVLSASIRNPETLFAVINFLTLPLIFTSNALFPSAAMPAWIQAIARLNPISYAVAPVRVLVVSGLEWSAVLTGTAVLLLMLGLALAAVTLRFEKGSLL